MSNESPMIQGIKARGVIVPMSRPLATAGGAVSQAPLALIDLETDGGIVGTSYVFCYAPFALAPTVRLIEELGGLLAGEALAPAQLMQAMQARFRLLGMQGLAMMAASGIDMAAWDALAKHQDIPLVRLLGGAPLPIPAYNSKGLGLVGLDRAPDEARELAAEGFSAIKLRLGYPDARTDLAVARSVRDAVGNDVRVMTDYNQSLSVAEAQTRARLLADTGIDWIEEPTRFDDYAGHARIRLASPVPIQLGENCWGLHDMEKALAAGACDLFMPDAGKIGGVTGWLRAVGLAETRGLPVSSHLYPEISVHLLAVTPTRHWLEYVDWAAPILKNPLQIVDGQASAPETAGIGLEWDEAAVARYMV